MTEHSLDIEAVKAALSDLHIGITDVDEAFNEIWAEFVPAHHAVYDTRRHCLMSGAELADLYTLLEGWTSRQEASARDRLRAFFDANRGII